MNDLKIKKQLYQRTPLKILSFLSIHPEIVFSAKEISKAAKSSRGATNQTLRLFLKLDILSREKKGNLFLYKLYADNLVLKQFKIFEAVLCLQRLVKEIHPYCYDITLFGSRADGSNGEKSDIDLYIRTEYKKEVKKIINKYNSFEAKLQAIIEDPLESIETKKENKVFYGQVEKGILLWKGKPSYESI